MKNQSEIKELKDLLAYIGIGMAVVVLPLAILINNRNNESTKTSVPVAPINNSAVAQKPTELTTIDTTRCDAVKAMIREIQSENMYVTDSKHKQIQSLEYKYCGTISY